MRKDWLAGSVALLLSLPAPGAFAVELEDSPQGQCWSAFTQCTEAAFGEEAWRSACYADLTICLRPLQPGQCQPASANLCDEFVSRCNEVMGNDPQPRAQCKADHDACRLSFGC
ncbi:hypothetical protein FHS85_003972 [Rhodoligotrophos appendicifer]